MHNLSKDTVSDPSFISDKTPNEFLIGPLLQCYIWVRWRQSRNSEYERLISLYPQGLFTCQPSPCRECYTSFPPSIQLPLCSFFHVFFSDSSFEIRRTWKVAPGKINHMQPSPLIWFIDFSDCSAFAHVHQQHSQVVTNFLFVTNFVLRNNSNRPCITSWLVNSTSGVQLSLSLSILSFIHFKGSVCIFVTHEGFIYIMGLWFSFR